MGVVDTIAEAKQLLEQELNFKLVSTPDEFLVAVDRAGKKRFKHCVELVKMWDRSHHTGRQKYDRLMALLRLVTPEKVGKYRNAAVGAAVRVQDALDEELGEILRREE
jgi:hypothetical protein